MNKIQEYDEKIEGATNLGELKVFVADERIVTNVRLDLALERADVIVKTILEVIDLAHTSCSVVLRNKLLTHFVCKFGINNFGELEKALSVVHSKINSKDVDEELISLIVSRANISGCLDDPGRYELSRLAKVAYMMVQFSPSQIILENQIVDLALPFIKGVQRMLDFANEQMKTLTGRLSMITGYTVENPLEDISEATELLVEINSVIVTDEISQGLLDSTRMAIYEAVAKLVAQDEPFILHDDLCDFASEIRDHSNDGSGSREIEDIVISLMLKRAPSIPVAVYCANRFFTFTGAHRFLRQFIEGFKGNPTQDEIYSLAGAVRGTNLEGSKVLVSLTTLVKRHGLEFDFEKSQDSKLQQPNTLVMTGGPAALENFENLIAAIMGGRGSADDCPCPVCQINRMIQEDPGKRYLPRMFEIAVQNLMVDGALAVNEYNAFYLPLGREQFERALERLKISEELRKIFRTAIDLRYRADPPSKAAGFMQAMTGSQKATPEDLRKNLQKAYEEGRLDNFRMMTAFGIKTIRELLQVDHNMIYPEYLEVLKEFALKLKD